MTSVLYKAENNIFRVSSEIPELHIGVVGRSANSIDYTSNISEIRKKEKEILYEITGFNKNNILFLNQVHGDNILIRKNTPENKNHTIGDADGIITDNPDLCLIIRTADCVPVFLYDKKKKILGAAHSGWRGTELSIVKKIINKMNIELGSLYQDIIAYILPSIGPESYVVNENVGKYFKNDTKLKDKKIYLNLWQNIEKSLIDEGVPEKSIFNSNTCNLKNKKNFFSHRNGDAGRNLNFGYFKVN